MSSQVFPSALAGLDIKVSREALHDTKVQQTLSGKELRSSWWTYPRYKYKLAFNVLRTDSSIAGRQQELQQLMAHLVRHYGQLDSFLFTDPDDSSVVDCGFGIGDGSTTAFQLQRALTGYKTDPYGAWPNGTKPRTNWIPQSANLLTNSNGWSLGTTPAAQLVQAPDGTTTASYIGLDAAGGGRIFCDVTDAGVSNQAYTLSLWMKADAPSTVTFTIRDYGTTTVKGTTTCQLTTSWQRFSVTGIPAQGGFRLDVAGAGMLYAWGAQGEVGTAATAYIPTTSAPLNATPVYWPGLGDGFEPVFDLNGPLSVFIDKDWRAYRQLFPYSRTNLLTFSETLTNAAWTKTSCAATVGVGPTDPSGGSNPNRITDSVTAGDQLFTQAPATIQGATYTFSIYARVGTNSTIAIKWSDGIGGTVAANFDLSAGTVTNGAALNPTITSLASGWFRCTVTGEAKSTSAGASVYVAGATFSLRTGDGTGTTYFFGAQLERGPVATGYVSSNAGSATTVGADYTLTGSVVTLASALAVNSVLSWTGSYFRRVRFNADNLNADRIFIGAYEAKTLELISVKP